MHAGAVLSKLMLRMLDPERKVRDALALLLKATVFPNLPVTAMAPFAGMMTVHVRSALTHLQPSVRSSALSYLDLLVRFYPSLLPPPFCDQVLGCYEELLKEEHILTRRLQLLESLVRFLGATRALYHAQTRPVIAAWEHHWGGRFGVGQQEASEPSSLHAYNSLRPPSLIAPSICQPEADAAHVEGEAISGRNLDGELRSEEERHMAMAATLVSAVLATWQELAQESASMSAPEELALRCMLLAVQALQFLLLPSSSRSLARLVAGEPAQLRRRSFTSKMDEVAAGHKLEGHGADVEEHFLPMLLQRLLPAFPIAAPSEAVPLKVQEDIISINIRICEVMEPFLAYGRDRDNGPQAWHQRLMDFYQAALQGTMMPSKGLAQAVEEAHSGDHHWRALLPCFPRFLSHASASQGLKLLEVVHPGASADRHGFSLQAFTAVYEASRPSSATRRACLLTMRCILMQEPASKVPTDMLRRWMQSLPRLLWELKDLHSSTSEMVLRLLLHLGRSAADCSPLASSFTSLQSSLVPFFGTFVQGEDVSAVTTIRIIEVVHRSFCQDRLGPALHLSFILTLLLDRRPDREEPAANAREKDQSYKAIEVSKVCSTIPCNRMNLMEEELQNLEMFDGTREEKKWMAVVEAACSSLVHVGDDQLLVELLTPALSKELTGTLKLKVKYAMLRALAAISWRASKGPNRLETGSLPAALLDTLLPTLTSFCASVFQGAEIDKKDEHGRHRLLRPCLALLTTFPSLLAPMLACLAHTVNPADHATCMVWLVQQKLLEKHLQLQEQIFEAALQALEEHAKSAEEEALKEQVVRLRILWELLLGRLN
eukprot:SM000186S04151  [mRNA]  locus=s186:248940:254822:- [translate_table: standard]